jgi:4-hydroxyphenylpyruvate dioxygenase
LTGVYLSQISNLKKRGAQFLKVPGTYYETLRENLKQSKVKVTEDMDVLQVFDSFKCFELFQLKFSS